MIGDVHNGILGGILEWIVIYEDDTATPRQSLAKSGGRQKYEWTSTLFFICHGILKIYSLDFVRTKFSKYFSTKEEMQFFME